MAINKRLIKSNDGVPTSFNTVLYTGNNAGSRTISGVGFNPDLVWIKTKTVAESHALFDVQRPAGQRLVTNSTNAAQQLGPAYAELTTDGFIVGGVSYNDSASGDYVAWCWKAGGAAVTNTDGTITSQVSANTEAGFSIVSYTGNGVNSTIGHGLGDTPKMLIIKNRDEVENWAVGHEYLSGNPWNNNMLFLNATNSVYTAIPAWGNQSPTSTTFGVGANLLTNSSGKNHIAYCFAEVAGFSKFGSYTGNGNGSLDSTGTVVAQAITTGFEPAFVMIKRTDATEHWMMFDNKRGGSSPGSEWKTIYADLSNAEADFTYAGGYSALVDFISYGFTLGNDPSLQVNASGGTYIYMAFANQF